MSSEKNSYATDYLARVPEPGNWPLTLVTVQADWHVLDSAGDAPSYEDNTFDLVICQRQLIPASDLFPAVQAMARVLKAGGLLLVQDVHVPDDDRAAAYVNALYRFHDPRHQISLAPYAWQGLLLDAGLTVEQRDTSKRPTRLQEWAAGCSPYVQARLHVLLAQAPAAVRDHLRPFATGSPDAMFTRAEVALIARKPDTN